MLLEKYGSPEHDYGLNQNQKFSIKKGDNLPPFFGCYSKGGRGRQTKTITWFVCCTKYKLFYVVIN
jgi:hypothetical protein